MSATFERMPSLLQRLAASQSLDTAQALGVRTDAAKNAADAAATVTQGLDAQRSAVSGVSVDEESVNLLTFQRQYQGAARFISVVDQMTQTLISLI